MNNLEAVAGHLNEFLSMLDITGYAIMLVGLSCIIESFINKKDYLLGIVWPYFLMIPFLWCMMTLPFYITLSDFFFIITHIFVGGTVFTRHILMLFAFASCGLILILCRYDLLKTTAPRYLLGIMILFSGFNMPDPEPFASSKIDYNYHQIALLSWTLMASGIIYILRMAIEQYRLILNFIWGISMCLAGLLFIVLNPAKIVPVGTITKHDDFHTMFLFFISIICCILLFIALVRYIRKESTGL